MIKNIKKQYEEFITVIYLNISLLQLHYFDIYNKKSYHIYHI